METYNEQGLDSPSKNSYIGSYYQPPERMIPLPRRLDFPFHTSISIDQPTTSQRVSQKPKTNIDSKAVVDRLRTLQEKITVLKLETSKQAEKSRQVFQDAQTHQPATEFDKTHGQIATLPLTYKQRIKETDGNTKSDSLETCKVIEKHTEKTKRSLKKAKKEHATLLDQTLQQKEQLSSNVQIQNEKLEKLESEYQQLRRTQTLAEMKLALLEEKLQKEEQERKLVQEKAEKLQTELDCTRRMGTEEMKTKKKTKKITKKTSRQSELKSPNLSRNTKMPFVAGTSTSPSHSVHANVQSILHMMKHHQPQLCERVSVLHKSSCGAKKCLQKDFSQSNFTIQRCHSERSDTEESLGSLSDLLLALQDELGQMSFEHQELMRQIDDTHDHKKRQDLKNELEQLVTRMDDKGAQITKLRKHQQMVHKLTKTNQQAPCTEETHKTSVIHPPAPSAVKAKKGKKSAPIQSNLQLLRETQQFRNTLKQSDLFWET